MNSITGSKVGFVVSVLIFSTIGIFRSSIPYPSSVIALSRSIIGVLFLLLLMLFKGEKIKFRATGGNILLLCLSGVLLGVNWIFLFEAYRYSVSVATVCYYMAPVIVAVVSPVLFHEKLTLRRILCLAAAVCGILCVSGVFKNGIPDLRAVIRGLCAAVMYASVIILNKLIRGMSAYERTVIQLGVAAASILPYAMINGELSGLTLSFGTLTLLLVLGIVHTGIAYALYFRGVAVLPARTVSLLSYLDPAVAVILAVLMLHEKADIFTAVGIVTVLGASVIGELPEISANNKQ